MASACRDEQAPKSDEELEQFEFESPRGSSPSEFAVSPEAASAEEDEVTNVPSSSSHVGQSAGASWEVLDQKGIRRVVCTEIEKLVEVMDISREASRVLLSSYGWDARVVLEQYGEDPERVYRRAGLSLGEDGRAPETGTTTCGSCLEEFPGESLLALATCGHRFCRSCWQTYLCMKIKEGESCRLKCMSFKCGTICDDTSVQELVESTDLEVASRFRRALAEAFVEENRTGMVKWCPSTPHCGRAIRLLGESTMELVCEVVCDCSKRFCFSCSEQAHTPCSCEMWKRWTEKEAGETAASNWIQAHSKPCPRCKKPVFKDGGCNHVTCRCGQSFCWHCGAATGTEHTWDRIMNHSCGSYKEEVAQKTQKAERDLKRYLHYYDRWKNHADSLKKEALNQETISDKIELLDKSLCQYLGGGDYSWLRNGATQLGICRRILSHSYVFAFFALGPTSIFADEVTPEQDIVNRNLFEMKQSELEHTVENLSRLVELPVEKMLDPGQISGIKQKIVDLTVNVDLRTLHLCQTVQNDILGKLSSPQGVAPYHPSTQVVQGISRRRNAFELDESAPKRQRHGHMA